MSVIDLFHPEKTLKPSPLEDKSACYYLMKNGYILRVEQAFTPGEIPLMILANMLEPENKEPMNQDQANYRVAIFRDEILEMDEYRERVFGHTA